MGEKKKAEEEKHAALKEAKQHKQTAEEAEAEKKRIEEEMKKTEEAKQAALKEAEKHRRQKEKLQTLHTDNSNSSSVKTVELQAENEKILKQKNNTERLLMEALQKVKESEKWTSQLQKATVALRKRTTDSQQAIK